MACDMGRRRRKYDVIAGRRRRSFVISLAVVVSALGLFTIAAYAVFDHYAGKLGTAPVPAAEPVRGETERGTLEDSPAEQRRSYESYLRENLESEAQSLPFDEKDVYSVLLIGTDESDGDEAGRSDSMILLSVNRAQRRLVMSSFMRDIYCAIPGCGYSRLNHAYAWGGPELLMETIGENFKIPLTNYVQVDFESFRSVVDTVGGVDIRLSQAEADYLNAFGADGMTEGVNRLDGWTALEYARMRNVGNADYERTARQRYVLTELIEKARGLSLTELDELAETLLPQIRTNISRAQLLSLVLGAGEYMQYETESCRIPCDGSMTDMVVDGMMVLGVDLERNRRVWYEAVYGPAEE